VVQLVPVLVGGHCHVRLLLADLVSPLHSDVVKGVELLIVLDQVKLTVALIRVVCAIVEPEATLLRVGAVKLGRELVDLVGLLVTELISILPLWVDVLDERLLASGDGSVVSALIEQFLDGEGSLFQLDVVECLLNPEFNLTL